MLPHLLTNFEIRKYYQNEGKFNGVDWRNNLPKIKNVDICKKSSWVWNNGN